MEKRKFGIHDEMLSIVGLGGISIKNTGQNKSDRLVRYAFDNGVNYFDVAPGYGDAQELMGRSLEGIRNDVFLACKTSNRRSKEADQDLENSLKLLKTNHFDLYQLHGMKSEKDFELVSSKGGALETLIKAKKQGKVKYIGFSCHSIKVAHMLLDNFEFDSILFPVNWNLILNAGFGPEVLKKADETETAVLALKSMADTLWKDSNIRDYEKCWYKPLNDKKMIDLAVKFTLSNNVVSFLPPGDESLFKMGLKAAQNFEKISNEELNFLKNKSIHSDPIGSSEEIFI
jgi:predicted aldo/keto reductase-like oxidoreductase